MKTENCSKGLTFSLLSVSLLLGGLLTGCTPAPEEKLLVFAAASLRDVLLELERPFERESGAEVRFNFAGSNILALQIEASGIGDVFLSADEEWMDFLGESDRVEPQTRRSFISNQLVFVGNRARAGGNRRFLARPQDRPASDLRYLALADPKGVPAGRYAREYLQGRFVSAGDFEPHRSLWQVYQDKIVVTADVRATLALVEADPEAQGIVYKSDALRSDLVEVLYEVPADEGPDIRYSAAVLKGAVDTSLAAHYLGFLAETRSLEVFERHGFIPIAQFGEEADDG